MEVVYLLHHQGLDETAVYLISVYSVENVVGEQVILVEELEVYGGG